MPSVLIVGGDSQIGRALSADLPGLGWSATATTRRPDAAAHAIRFDLSAPPDAWPELPRADAAVLCAAATRQRDCEDDPAGTARVNRDGAIRLARRLTDAGAFVLLLSTVAVFDGRRPYRRHDEAPCPANAYGRQKAEAEEAVLEDRSAAVLRLSKVMGPDMPLLAHWVAELRNDRAITAFDDAGFAPVSARFVVGLVDRILRCRRHGIYHASGDRDLPYATFAAMLCDALRAPGTLCEVRPSGGAAAAGHTTLDMSLERDLFGVDQPGSEATIRQALNDLCGGGSSDKKAMSV